MAPTNQFAREDRPDGHSRSAWFGGMLALPATAMVVALGDIDYGSWHPIVVALITCIVGAVFRRDHKDRDPEAD